MRRLAIAALAALLLTAAATSTAAAASPFAWRGIIEGPYGPPWDHAARLRVLDFMAHHGFNAYVHAPKEDLYQRTQWRDPYPAAQQAEFNQEIAYARARGIEWIPNLSPGLPLIPTPGAPQGVPSQDICYSCPPEIDVLLAKLQPFWNAGERTFMLSFDDVQKVLTHPEDIAAYGTGDNGYGKANGDLLSRFYRALRARDPASRLLSVGADYTGSADTAYLMGLRATLDPGVELMWTGPGTYSVNFTPAQVRGYAAAAGRTPIVWDNWTVNDGDGNIFGQTNRIHLGAYQRKPDLVGEVRGFFLNPMNEADLNLLPFSTAADYFAHPAGYDPQRSFLAHVGDYGSAPRDYLRAFAEVNWSTHFDLADEAPTFRRQSAAFLNAYSGGGEWPAPRSDAIGELGLVAAARGALARVPALANFVAQAGPFLDAAAKGAAAGRAGADLLAAERPALELRPIHGGFAGRTAPPDPAGAASARSALGGPEAAFRGDPRFTFGYRGVVFDIPPVQAPPNKMDGFLDAVHQLDAAWQPQAPSAASSVRLLLGGRPVAVGQDGSFQLARSADGKLLEAIDGAGGRTALRISAAAAEQSASCVDRSAPRVAIDRRRSRISRRTLRLRGSASDFGCLAGRASLNAPLRSIEVAVSRRAGRRCRFLRANGRLGSRRSCGRPTYLRATAKASWRLLSSVRLGPASYGVRARARDRGGNLAYSRAVSLRVR